ncbi:hypothetical protein SCLCIDRAFT_832947 [Scleroderma citrinum Foug A]|uniref:Uncharacterized protein n=1 Tax=Scleroderma citrinum Foug A TaxID=1036808 RepID=A0A0C3DNS8_9AGAM|nr:hypothetical protein SCLCIDRAFT_832947 [Scleroderma citrinum Foug A]
MISPWEFVHTGTLPRCLFKADGSAVRPSPSALQDGCTYLASSRWHQHYCNLPTTVSCHPITNKYKLCPVRNVAIVSAKDAIIKRCHALMEMKKVWGRNRTGLYRKPSPSRRSRSHNNKGGSNVRHKSSHHVVTLILRVRLENI